MPVVRHPSCETEDTTITGFVVGAETAQIKTRPVADGAGREAQAIAPSRGGDPCGRALRGPGRPRTVRRVDLMTVS